MRNKQYCILNKQYSKEEYQALVPKIKQFMIDVPYVDKLGRVYKYGEFFPLDFSPYAVNETAVMDFMEMDKEKAQKYGLVWREANPREYKTTILAKDLPDHIRDATDRVFTEVIACASCEKGYRIIPNELHFLRRFNLPLPRICFNCRHEARVKLRNHPVWYSGKCQCAGTASTSGAYMNVAKHSHDKDQPCGNEFETTFLPNYPGIVYCDSCWQAEMYS
ncbi:MAG: hypothetical protein COU68_00475 [Candidatus Pacebacteria bacterium CG10_big_fil_rev_8_21_14_0_10_45_6]|nr:MAG: hypothetical protein COU68_00475 [Candidatus Pacebacteria bacterium CG10_big_fil_rev_8_21_14_0_10_45_6]